MTTSTAVAADRRLNLVFVAGVVLLGLTAGFAGAGRPSTGGALVVLATGCCLVAARPVLCAVLAVPAVYGFQSVGLGGSLGLSDVLLLAGALLALPALARTPVLKQISPLNRAVGVYLALLLPSLVAHPTAAAGREGLHRLLIVSGAVLAGAWLVHESQERRAVRLLLMASAFFAVASVATWLTNGHQPAYPLGYHKNYAGSLLALSLLLVLCAPSATGWHKRYRLPLIALLVIGLLATQSRGAILGAALGALFWLFAPVNGSGVQGRSRVAALVLAAGFGLYAGYSVQAQLNASDVQTTSVGVRRQVEARTREIWRSAPVEGVGLRYFNSGQYGPLAQASNNALSNELAEAGVVGAAGFVVFHVLVFRALWRRRRTALGLAAVALFSGQLLHGMFDIYWSSGITPVPFLLAGMALAQPWRGNERSSSAPAAAVAAGPQTA